MYIDNRGKKIQLTNYIIYSALCLYFMYSCHTICITLVTIIGTIE